VDVICDEIINQFSDSSVVNMWGSEVVLYQKGFEFNIYKDYLSSCSYNHVGSDYYTFENFLMYWGGFVNVGGTIPYYHTERYIISNDTLYTFKVEEITEIGSGGPNNDFPYQYRFPISQDTSIWIRSSY